MKTAAVDLALRYLAGQPMTREEALAMGAACAIAELLADVPPAEPGPRWGLLAIVLATERFWGLSGHFGRNRDWLGC
jgi:hypothetical protein